MLAGDSNVDGAAADGDSAGDLERIEAVVAVFGEPDDEFLGFKLLADAQGPYEMAQLVLGGDRLHQGLDGGDEKGRCGGSGGVQFREKFQTIRGLFLADLA